MLKYGWLALVVLVVFGAAFTLLRPPASVGSTTDVVLRGVRLRMYPTQDQSAEWRFAASEVTYDPVASQTNITRPTQGERYVRNASGIFELDSTLSTSALTIDANSNLRMTRATVAIPSQCASATLTGSQASPVVVQQDVGFVAPKATMRAPSYSADVTDMQATFALVVQRGRSKLRLNPDSTAECVDGKIIQQR
ncbi:hypothetical protein [Deinococcus yavapaiensis]|uniref:LPS export ABC transporter periplasmic protein LptC n=1 Tax=Deinococcus yavapaiensis KR-236 TaxID=694435 RepID=A0A318SEG0_9DEIO|nr:hypothetical protein [Deinococcus yavapaiensis]PYE55928.1 hypothetical protein DES52_102295 [Deinococcus yavapaiensis KR-236]